MQKLGDESIIRIIGLLLNIGGRPSHCRYGWKRHEEEGLYSERNSYQSREEKKRASWTICLWSTFLKIARAESGKHHLGIDRHCLSGPEIPLGFFSTLGLVTIGESLGPSPLGLFFLSPLVTSPSEREPVYHIVGHVSLFAALSLRRLPKGRDICRTGTPPCYRHDEPREPHEANGTRVQFPTRHTMRLSQKIQIRRAGARKCHAQNTRSNHRLKRGAKFSRSLPSRGFNAGPGGCQN